MSRRGGAHRRARPHAYVLLNLFPYNSGHLLVCPYRHIATYDEATAEEVAEIGELTQTAMRVAAQVVAVRRLQHRHEPGPASPAPASTSHLHQHIVPRWALDANFFPIIAEHQGAAAACSARCARRSPRRGPPERHALRRPDSGRRGSAHLAHGRTAGAGSRRTPAPGRAAARARPSSRVRESRSKTLETVRPRATPASPVLRAGAR